MKLKEATTPLDYQIGADLFKEYAAFIDVDLQFQNFDEELRHIQQNYSRPKGALFIAYNDLGSPMGCYAIRPFEDSICELKRMYVKPEFQGKGLGSKLLHNAVFTAQELGYQKMRLDTLPSMKHAIALYSKFGFYPIDPYRFNPIEGSIFMEINLG